MQVQSVINAEQVRRRGEEGTPERSGSCDTKRVLFVCLSYFFHHCPRSDLENSLFTDQHGSHTLASCLVTISFYLSCFVLSSLSTVIHMNLFGIHEHAQNAKYCINQNKHIIGFTHISPNLPNSSHMHHSSTKLKIFAVQSAKQTVPAQPSIVCTYIRPFSSNKSMSVFMNYRKIL